MKVNQLISTLTGRNITKRGNIMTNRKPERIDKWYDYFRNNLDDEQQNKCPKVVNIIFAYWNISTDPFYSFISS